MELSSPNFPPGSRLLPAVTATRAPKVDFWRWRPAGGFTLCEWKENRRRDAGATKGTNSETNIPLLSRATKHREKCWLASVQSPLREEITGLVTLRFVGTEAPTGTALQRPFLLDCC
jgi:hypothetical protein